MAVRASLQEFADSVVAPEYRQHLKTLDDALAVHGWAFVDRPFCCGSPIDVRSFIGAAYFAKCESCGRFIVDISGPSFSESGSSVSLPSSDKVDLDTEQRWIAGVYPHTEPIIIEPVSNCRPDTVLTPAIQMTGEI